ncbi:MAG TPA: serine/threonine-protein kinase [Kofleriaceae bacterium]|nr:serine/threonine-protein kinase [Kofleriaceae bacterium]
MGRSGASSEVEDVGVAPGEELLGKYRVESVLGKGGMGVVVKAMHLGLGDVVAIKMLRPDVLGDAEAASRFLREAQAAVKLKSEHVARVTDVGLLDNGGPYMVMEFLEGVDLDQMLEASGVVSPTLAVDLVLQACEAIGEAHSIGIVHRDLKPSNFFVTWRADGSPLCKVLDFGISKAPVGVEMSLTRTQSVLGTPAYMSPEQMRSARTVDARSDIWSLGTVLYELLCAHRPFEAESFSEMCVKVAVDSPTPLSVMVPPGLDAVIYRCLEKDPARRWQSVAELARALAPYAADHRGAAVVVDRVTRMLARGGGGGGGVPLSEASSLRPQTPFPQLHTPVHTPVPQTWDRTPGPTPMPVPVAGGVTVREPKRRSRVAVVAFAAVATMAVAAITVAIGSSGSKAEEPTSAPAAAKPTPTPTPKVQSTTAPTQAPTPAPTPTPAPAPVPSTTTPTTTSPSPSPSMSTTTTTTTTTPTTTTTSKPKRHSTRVKAGAGSGSAKPVEDDVFGKRH